MRNFRTQKLNPFSDTESNEGPYNLQLKEQKNIYFQNKIPNQIPVTHNKTIDKINSTISNSSNFWRVLNNERKT